MRQPLKVKQSSLHVNFLMSQHRNSQDTAHTSAQIIISIGKHTLREADGCDNDLKLTFHYR